MPELTVHLLDVGTQKYGDAILCAFGGTTVLIDGGHRGDDDSDDRLHPSIPDQLARLTGQGEPLKVTLLVVTHAHDDHVGCLPELVDQRRLDADWALVADPDVRWGRETDSPRMLAAPRARLAEALLEEWQPDATDEEVARLMADGEALEPRYRAMLRTLAERRTRVLRYGVDGLEALVADFRRRGVGLTAFGPSTTQLTACGRLIRGTRDALLGFGERLQSDSPADLGNTYRAFVGGLRADDALLDAASRDKGAINDTSLVLGFDYQGVRILTTGDMQLVEPEVSDPAIDDEMRLLRERIAHDGPWSLVKLSHHGSYNGFDEDSWRQIGEPGVLGICTGSNSTSHPNPETLSFLKAHRQQLSWARTDRNGLITFTWQGDRWNIEPTRRQLNDGTPPGSGDVAVGGGAAPVSLPARAEVSRVQQTDGRVEIVARLPFERGRVTLTIDVDPRQPGAVTVASPDRPRTPALRPAAKPGLERGESPGSLAGLAFLTNAQALSDNIGSAEAAAALRSLRERGAHVIDDAPQDPAGGSARLRSALPPRIKGIVLLGGYDVLRPQIVDALPKRLREGGHVENDPDDFIVWSDDVYADLDGDGLPELPVSRIPDGQSSRLVAKALAVSAFAGGSPRSGLRNSARPFADAIYDLLPGNAQMLRSEPASHSDGYDLSAAHVYVMLHGSDKDGTRFSGETDEGYVVAMTPLNVPAAPGMVVFTGCCWGALAAWPPANRFGPTVPISPRTPASSLALRFLEQGAHAFVGCTGAHYSPEPGVDGGGAPMHRAFWQGFLGGRPPAQALFEAKLSYVRGIPHGHRSPATEAIEFKILRQYTCLGLGW